MKPLKVIIILCLPYFLGAQNFTSPVKHKITLSGSFGELRTGHFHGGLDIRSARGIQGDSIFSIADGYISRIKVEPGGYGNSLYIRHPSGYTSVYAHLKEFSPDIDRFVRQNQTASQCFTQDIRFNETIFPVKQKEYIALMGNTGRSFGPHLHFEIRKSSTDELINPILFGIKPSDNRRPKIKNAYLYQYDRFNNICSESNLSINKLNDNLYKLGSDSIFINDIEKIALSLNVFDQMNASSNKNGLYRIQTLINGQIVRDFKFDSLEFEDSNLIKHIFDYNKKKTSKQTNYLLNFGEDSTFSFSERKHLNLEINQFDISIKIWDKANNQIKLALSLYSKNITIKDSHVNHQVSKSDSNLIVFENYQVLFSPESFQNQQGLFIDQKHVMIDHESYPLLQMSPHYHNLNIPLKINYIAKDNQKFNEKYCFVNYSEKGEFNLISNCTNEQSCMTELYELKDVFILCDTFPPSITPLFKKKSFYSGSSIHFEIKDNLMPTKKSQYLRYTCTLNGVWVLLSYDLKSNKISYQIPKSLQKGKYDIELQVIDNQSNSACFFSNIKII